MKVTKSTKKKSNDNTDTTDTTDMTNYINVYNALLTSVRIQGTERSLRSNATQILKLLDLFPNEFPSEILKVYIQSVTGYITRNSWHASLQSLLDDNDVQEVVTLAFQTILIPNQDYSWCTCGLTSKMGLKLINIYSKCDVVIPENVCITLLDKIHGHITNKLISVDVLEKITPMCSSTLLRILRYSHLSKLAEKMLKSNVKFDVTHANVTIKSNDKNMLALLVSHGFILTNDLLISACGLLHINIIQYLLDNKIKPNIRCVESLVYYLKRYTSTKRDVKHDRSAEANDIIRMFLLFGYNLTYDDVVNLTSAHVQLDDFDNLHITLKNDFPEHCSKFNFFPAYSQKIKPSSKCLEIECSRRGNIVQIKKLVLLGAQLTQKCLHNACTIHRNTSVINFLISKGLIIDKDCVLGMCGIYDEQFNLTITNYFNSQSIQPIQPDQSVQPDKPANDQSIQLDKPANDQVVDDSLNIDPINSANVPKKVSKKKTKDSTDSTNSIDTDLSSTTDVPKKVSKKKTKDSTDSTDVPKKVSKKKTKDSTDSADVPKKVSKKKTKDSKNTTDIADIADIKNTEHAPTVLANLPFDIDYRKSKKISASVSKFLSQSKKTNYTFITLRKCVYEYIEKNNVAICNKIKLTNDFADILGMRKNDLLDISDIDKITYHLMEKVD